MRGSPGLKINSVIHDSSTPSVYGQSSCCNMWNLKPSEHQNLIIMKCITLDHLEENFLQKISGTLAMAFPNSRMTQEHLDIL